MKILISCRGYVSGEKCEPGIFELDQAKALRDAGNEVRLAAFDLRSVLHRRPYGILPSSVEGMPVYYCSLPLHTPVDDLNRSLLQQAGNMVFHRLKKENWIPDIIHGHFGDAFSSAAHRQGIPFIYTEHFSGIVNAERTEKDIRRDKKLYANVDRLICVSRPLADCIFQNTGHRAVVVHDIIDTELFSVERTAHGGEVFRFVSCGNLIYRKGFDLLLRAAAELKKRGSLFTIDIIGDGVERQALQEMQTSLGLQNEVRFLGRMSRDCFAGLYAETDAFVLPSRGETFGVVYGEAMAAGLPVIATICSGPEDFVNDSNGILIPREDLPALVSAMDQMISNRSHYDSSAISQYAVKNFSPAMISACLTELYREVLSR